MTDEQIAAYIGDHAPELDPEDVKAFMAEHAKPDEERGSHIEWAVQVLRQRGEGETGHGLPVDSVVDEIRRRER